LDLLSFPKKTILNIFLKGNKVTGAFDGCKEKESSFITNPTVSNFSVTPMPSLNYMKVTVLHSNKHVPVIKILTNALA